MHHQGMVIYGLTLKGVTSNHDSPHENILTRTHTERHDLNDLSSRSNITDNYFIHLHFIGRVPRDDSSAALFHYALYMNNGHVTGCIIAEESIFGRLSH